MPGPRPSRKRGYTLIAPGPDMSGPYYAAARKRMYCHTRPGVNHVRPYIFLLRQPIAIYNII